MKKPDIALVYDNYFGDELGNDFAIGLDAESVNVFTQKYGVYDEPKACAEWFLPSLITAYVAKPYFEAMLQELGKEHFQLLKKKLSDIGNDTIKKRRIEPTFVATPGKISGKNPYSHSFSIMVESQEGFTFQLLIPKYSENCDYQGYINTFMDFVNDYHLGLLPNFKVEAKDIVVGRVFVCINEVSGQIEIAPFKP
ncbi:hypothetical protein CX029_18110 [Vibrio cholerae]|nr:hypothetical protein [Vibrio cholerae]HDV5564539.1 hypothetical protein [Vibrio cholerae]